MPCPYTLQNKQSDARQPMIRISQLEVRCSADLNSDTAAGSAIQNYFKARENYCIATLQGSAELRLRRGRVCRSNRAL